MVERPRGMARPEAWWGVIQSAARQRATTAQLWAAIREFGEAQGIRYPPGMFRAVNEMRATATRLRVASERLARAPASAALTSEYTAPQIYARSATERAALPQWHVRVEYEASRMGTTELRTATLQYAGTLPSTVGELWDQITESVHELANSYGVAFSRIASVEIGEV